MPTRPKSLEIDQTVKTVKTTKNWQNCQNYWMGKTVVMAQIVKTPKPFQTVATAITTKTVRVGVAKWKNMKKYTTVAPNTVIALKNW